MNFVLKTIAFTLALATSATPLMAQSKLENKAVQYAMKRFGYYDGTIDGIAGSGTRSAIASFASDNDANPTYYGILLSSKFRSIPWELDWTEAFDVEVADTLAGILLDADSAKTGDYKVAYMGENGKNISVCVEVNAKNRNGAYSGFQVVYFTGSMYDQDNLILWHVPTSQTEAEIACGAGYVMQDS